MSQTDNDKTSPRTRLAQDIAWGVVLALLFLLVLAFATGEAPSFVYEAF